MSNFREMAPQWLQIQIGCSKNLKLLKYEHVFIILKHVVWRFRIYNYFREILKFRDFMNTLRNFAKSVLLIFSRNLNEGCCLAQVVCLTLILECEVLVLGSQEGTPYSNIHSALLTNFSSQINQDFIFLGLKFPTFHFHTFRSKTLP